MTSSHTILNYVLFVALILLLVWCCNMNNRAPHETFLDGGQNELAEGPFHASPTCPYPTSVFSSYPPQHQDDRAWQFVTPFQSACMTGDTTECKSNSCQQKFVCNLNPHNRRICHWE